MASAEVAADAVPASEPVKAKKARAPKGSKPAPTHPTYLQMVSEAISSLKDRTGSSQYAIAAYIDDKYKAHLPANYKKLLTVQLRNLAKSGKLVKVKGSFKLPPDAKKASKVPAAKEKAAEAKPAKPKAPAKSGKASAAAAKPRAAKSAAKDAKASKEKPATAPKKAARPARPAKKAGAPKAAKGVAAKKKASVPKTAKSVKKTPKKAKK